MKIWHGYGTEHSMNLKLIGHFSAHTDAVAAAKAIANLTEAAEQERENGHLEVGEPPHLFGEELLRAMSAEGVHSLGHSDIEQFLYDVAISIDDLDVIAHTDEIDVMAFVKVLIAKGAKVEMYSMHDHEGTLD